MSLNLSSSWSTRGLGLALAVSVAACAAVPVTRTGKPTVKSSASATGSQTPKPTPSLGLLLQGKVTVDPTAMLNGNIVKATVNGVKVISDNGLGVISDNGLGLISNNGSGVISDNGLGVISNNAAGYRIPSFGVRYQVQATSSGGLKPVEGMLIRAVSLFDGKVLAGPVASRADGSYKLGFIQTPERNMRIEAVLPDDQKATQFAYEALVAPSPTDVVNSDSSRAIARYILGVLPARIQPWVDAVKDGHPKPVGETDTPYEKDIKNLLARIPAAKMKEADVNGAVAMGISERIVSFADLTSKGYTDFYALTEKARKLGESLSPPPATPFVEQVMDAVKQKQGATERLQALFVSAGMPEPEAAAYTEDLMKSGEDVGALLLLVLLAHQHEVFGPVEALATVQ